jgi:putative NADH-flavin reductase
MRLAIFGATGTVGSELLAQATDAGHEVRALVRDPARLADVRRRVAAVRGDVKDLAAVEHVVSDCDAVLSTLGARRGDDPDTRSAGTENVIAAMHRSHVKRLVVMGGFHLDVPGDPHNVGRRLIVPKLMGVVVEDTTTMAALVLDSDLDWTLVRAPRMVNGRPKRSPRVGTLKLGPWNKVTRADVAAFMLRCLSDSAYLRRAPMVSG